MNTNSVEAGIVARASAPTIRDTIAQKFLEIGPSGATGEEVVAGLVTQPNQLHKCFYPRLAELKGVSLGHDIVLVRTGWKRDTENGNSADILIHVRYASDGQVGAHIAWVMDEREKGIKDREAWIQKVRAAGIPTVDPVALFGEVA
jgi:hypothetical protein